MSNRVFLGIDTSNYTTSLALLTEEGELLANIKRPLPVRPGEVGLRQSDAVFAHVKNLPSAFAEAEPFLRGHTLAAVGVSTRPRNQEGSYMPCFLSGISAASAVAATTGVPRFSFSHQCGHIMAALYSAGHTELADGEFCAVHVSGGTTEVLRVRGTESGFSAQIVGGSRDLHAGQVIDRVGVKLGLPFPAGPHMEKLALGYTGRIPKKKPSVDGTFLHLSGLENLADKLYAQTNDPAQVAAFVLRYIADALDTVHRAYRETYGSMPTVFAGGVMSCSLIRDRLIKPGETFFAAPALSADNAVGIAVLTRRMFLSQT